MCRYNSSLGGSNSIASAFSFVDRYTHIKKARMPEAFALFFMRTASYEE